MRSLEDPPNPHPLFRAAHTPPPKNINKKGDKEMTQAQGTEILRLRTYLSIKKAEIISLLDSNMFCSARLVLNDTIEEYETRVNNGEIQ